MELPTYNSEGVKGSVASLPAALVAAPVRKALLYYMVRQQLAGRRAGTHQSKTRGMVRGSTRKLYRQKGTGRARHGDIKANIYVGGGKAFGPHPRDYAHSLPKKAKRKALESAIKLKIKEEKVKLVETPKWESPNTKQAKELLKALNSKNALLVLAENNEVVEKSVRNLPGYKVILAQGLNVYDVLLYEDLLLSPEAWDQVQKRLGW